MLKKNLLAKLAVSAIAACAISTVANAAVSGPYVGGQVGWGNTNINNNDIFGNNSGISSSIDNTGVAGRIFAGYQFNPNWAAELGYTRFSDTDINDITAYGVPVGNGSLREQAFDLVGKGILPLQNNFNLYGKLGAAYLQGDMSFNGSGVSTTGDENKVYPTYGVGISYDVTPNVPVDLSWNRIQKVGDSDLQSTDLIAVGIAYNFGS